MVPALPTAMTVLESKVATANSQFPCGSGFCQYQPDWAWELTGCEAVSPSNRKRNVLMTTPLVKLRGRSFVTSHEHVTFCNTSIASASAASRYLDTPAIARLSRALPGP